MKVVTNSIAVIPELAPFPQIQLEIPGGSTIVIPTSLAAAFPSACWNCSISMPPSSAPTRLTRMASASCAHPKLRASLK
jgi:hypothetical protein